MRRASILLLLAITALAVVLTAGCKDDDRTKISKILEQPDKYVDRDVIIAGEVIKTYGVDLFIAEAGAYQVDDGTGKIWVISKNGVPREGVKVGLKGRVSSGLRLGREVFGAVIREEERKTK
ncbi:MAG TPA: hypothetical protein PLZ21_02430 [Armatimonadota bacterium]|nr:hypothetical protein [Armatimonadota bacterium]HOM73261.1 hypothetical protein [Armatimonadota bacterium]HOP79398.1 hypothetical protein [Armatimonadota bacterium]